MLGLDRVAAVWSRMDRGHPRRVLTVAGTNGKGSVVETAGAIAKASSLRFGQYTSPHLLSVRERVRIDGMMVDEDVLVSALDAVEVARQDVALTYFEFLTLAGFEVFQRQALDLWILEIGLGGRLDAVNVVDPDVSVITSIGLDHMEYLGHQVDDIAVEKAGIMRGGKPCFSAARNVSATLEAEAKRVNASLVWLDELTDAAHTMQTETGAVDLSLTALPAPSVGLAIAAMQALHALPNTPLDRLVTDLQMPGRMTRRTINDVHWVLDVGHNPAACEFVTERLLQATQPARRVVICGLLADKNAEAIAPILQAYADQVVLVGLSGPRGRSADALASVWQATTAQTPWRTFATLASALTELAPDLLIDTEVLVIGSFTLVADALQHELFN